MAENLDALTPKSRKRPAAKASSRPDASRVKLTLYLDADLAKRFTVHAAMLGMDKSALFGEMVRSTCKRFVVSDRERGPEPTGTEAA